MRIFLLSLLLLQFGKHDDVEAFTPLFASPALMSAASLRRHRQSSIRYCTPMNMASSGDDAVTGLANDNNNKGGNDENFPMTDDDLLDTVSKSQFEQLCQQLDLPTTGSKKEMLLRLRQHAEEQAALDRKQRRDRRRRVEEGGNEDARERHEIVGSSSDDYYHPTDGDEEEEEEGYFFFELPTPAEKKKRAASVKTGESGSNKQKQKTKKRPYITQSDVLAPPPPPYSEATVNEDGKRVVTVYSTTDHNDLTGVAAAQPGAAAMSGTDPMSAGSMNNQPQPWDFEQRQKTVKATTSSELEQAKEKVSELVQTLLAMTGAPAFRHFDMMDEMEDLQNNFEDDITGQQYTNGYSGGNPTKSNQAVGFDPSKVPTQVLLDASKALRAKRGEILQEVLREFELHAVGQDGMAGDKLEDGGGHFKEVAKVRAFLEGFRRGEVRKAARVTVTFLLDKLASEGVEGLDLTLATMSRSNDDSTSINDEYELNDSLISYLNDIIREQETKVKQQLGSKKEHSNDDWYRAPLEAAKDDPIEGLWNQTKGEKGESIQSIDPKDPKVSRALQEEMDRGEHSATSFRRSMDDATTAAEKLLLLLTLLRDRIKTEAAFANDDRNRNLRLLGYCLQCTTETDWDLLIRKDLGSSVDRIDEFMELVSSSIEYAESTSHQLQPAKRMPLNVPVLKRILAVTEALREQLKWKAAGLRP